MKPALVLLVIPCLALSNSLSAADIEKHVFKYRETNDETAEWHVAIEVNNGSLTGRITTYGLKPLDFPTNKVWAIDKEMPPTITELTGKVVPGPTKQKRKLEVREVTTGDEPMWIQFTKGQASWTLVAKSDALYELQVPVKYYMGRHEYKKLLNFKEENSAPSSEPKSDEAPAKADNSQKIIGVWVAEKKSDDATEVIMKFKPNFTFSFEVEESAFDSGTWKIIGDNIFLTGTNGGRITFPIKFVSYKVLLWANTKGKGSKLTRLE